MKIKKTNMADRADAAGAATPGLTDRFAHARALQAHNPAAVDRDSAPSVQVSSVPAPSPAAGPITTPPGSQTAAGLLAIVPVDQIDENPFNARKVYRPQRIAELAASIGANGQDTPGTATIRNGRHVLAAGHYRLKACTRLNRPMLLLIKPDMTDRELYEISYRENKEREEQTTLDNALSWRDLLDKGVYESETDLADATSTSLATINKTLATLKLKEEILSIVREQPAVFGISIAYELVLLQEVADTATMIDTALAVVEGKISRLGIQDIRSRLETPKPGRKPKETSRIYKIQRDGASGSMKTWDNGKVSFEVTLSNPDERHKLISQLQEQFKLSD